MAKIRVLCVDDSEDLARLYCMLIDEEPDMECVGTLASAETLLDESAKLLPDVVLLDLTMPGPDPLDEAKKISNLYPQTRVLLFSGYDQKKWVDAAYEAGAWGLVSKHGEPTAVLEAIREVAAGKAVFPGNA